MGVISHFAMPILEIKLTLNLIIILYFNSREQLKRNYNLRRYCLEVDLHDLASFDPSLAEKVTKLPAEFLPLVRLRLLLCV